MTIALWPDDVSVLGDCRPAQPILPNPPRRIARCQYRALGLWHYQVGDHALLSLDAVFFFGDHLSLKDKEGKMDR